MVGQSRMIFFFDNGTDRFKRTGKVRALVSFGTDCDIFLDAVAVQANVSAPR